ncbi:MAG: MFS transporter, partial [Actinobacteria bacterium]|nr:MFS transporter [Actinomycetota bacterium]
MDDSTGIRLQKVLAAAGIGSRRKCEDLIAQGRVEVDGKRVERMGVRVNPDTAVVRVDGERINVAPGNVYLALNKPAGVVTTMSDDLGRPCIGDFFSERRERLFHV